MSVKLVRDLAKDVITLPAAKNLPLTCAIEEMKSRGIGSIIIVNPDNSIAGIFTSGDLLELIASGELDLHQSLNNSMTGARQMITITLDDSISTAITRMRDNQISHLPVVNKGIVVSIITQTDIEEYVLNAYSNDDFSNF